MEKVGLAYKWKVLWSMVFGLFMVVLDSTVVNVAFPTLRAEFGGSLSDSQWVLSVYVMALGIATPLSGFLGDRYGMKKMYMTGLTLFVVGSFACGIASNLPFLIIARALQGFGGGLALPLGSAQLFRVFPPNEQGKAFGIFGITLAMAPALGPLVGGYLVSIDVWRWIFYINIPIGIMGIFINYIWVKETLNQNPPELNWIGVICSSIAFGSLLYAASIAADYGWLHATVLSFFALGFVFLSIFVYLELKRSRFPLLDLTLFKNPIFLFSTLIGWVATIALFGAEFLMPVYLQALRGYSALETGIYLLPLALSAGIFTGLSGFLYDKIGPRVLIIVGYTLLLINTWQFSQLDADTPLNQILWLLTLRGVAIGCTVQATFTSALGCIAVHKVSRGSALINASRNVIQAIGVAVLATILSASLSPKIKQMQDQFQEKGTKQSEFVGICQKDPKLERLNTVFTQQNYVALTQKRAQACQENLKGLDNAYIFTFYVTGIALVLALFLPGWPGKWGGRDDLRQGREE